MSNGQENYFDYPLSDSEILDCVSMFDGITTGLFGSAAKSKALVESKEYLGSNLNYYHITRRIFLDDLEPIVHIEFNGFTPTITGSTIQDYESDEDGDIYIAGTTLEISVGLSEKKLSVSHGIGYLTLNAIGDVELDVIDSTDEEPIDPIAEPGELMFTDYLRVQAFHADIQS